MWLNCEWAEFVGTVLSSDREKKINRRVLTFSFKPWIWSFDVVVLQRTAKKCTKMHDAREDLLIKPIVLWRSRNFFDHSCILFNI